MTALVNQIAKRLGGLPPDPEGMNDKRSKWAEAALKAFDSFSLTSDRDDIVADLLTDLMHWCDRNNTDFDAELARAIDNYVAEITPDL